MSDINKDAQESICIEILDIMRVYDEQDASGYVDTPGGIENVSDVWRLMKRWQKELTQ